MSIVNLRELKYNLAKYWVEAQLPEGVAVTWLNQNSPAPELPFVGLLVRNFRTVGRNDVGAPDAAGVVQHRGNREFILEAQAFGMIGAGEAQQDAGDILQNLIETLQYETVQQALIDKGIFFITGEDVLDTSALFGKAKIESRALVEIRFRIGIPYGTTAEAEETTDVIESVEITSVLDGEESVFTVPEEA